MKHQEDSPKRKRPKWKTAASIVAALVPVFAIAVGFYAYRNLNYDKAAQKLIRRAGMIEKQATLPDGSVLNYGEGPANGLTPLMLLHGQNVSWEDYANVLPELTKHYHVFAVDYYGHGGSSKNPDKYSAKAIGEDLIWFLEEIIQQPAVVSGHSSGGLLTAWLAANAPDSVRGVVVEDAPFFSTEPGRAEKTFAGLGFKLTHDFLNQTEETNYTRYSLEHTYMQEFFNADGQDNWSKIVKDPAFKYMDKHPGKVPRLWFYPPSLGVNELFDLTANLQDGTGDYDLRFGETFYDYSWFEGFDQAETLARIQCPTTILHVAASDATAPSYYDKNGILVSAMDNDDAARAQQLVAGSELIGGFKSNHDIHKDRPQEFTDVLVKFKDKLDLS
ncbi:MAG: alpha/beta hydrolase [Ancrocorticia sp.]